MSASFRFPRMALAVLFCMLSASALGAVPHKEAVPAYAEEQTILQSEKDVREPGFGSTASGRRHFDRHFIVPMGNMTEQDLILQRGGNTWRILRNGPLALVSGFILLVTPLLLAGLYTVFGPSRIERPETGHKVQRFSGWDRLVHWATAISFLVLAFTGLVILFGKQVLLPWMGATVFSWLALISKYLHNFVGPLFIVCSVLMFVTFLRRNSFNRYDWHWVKSGGGLLKRGHVPAGYFNAGEKFWFWFGVVLLGLVMSVSGLLLNFVNFGQTRYVLQWANYFHLGAATFYIALAMGHIYLGTLGTPGAYAAMRDGTADEEWIRTHHELWYEELLQQHHAQQGMRDGTPYGTPQGPR